MVVEFVLAKLYAALGLFFPIFSLLLSLEGFAKGRIALDADDGPPGVSLLEFSFENGHSPSFIV